MALNKNALIRYRTIDKCLQNRQRTWTLEELIEACSDALYEYEGRVCNVSKRTTQLDIQVMRSSKLGYSAPIEVYNKKYYKYSDPQFTITDIPLKDSDMQVLMESVEMLKQFKDFSLFTELNGVLQKLEDKVYSEKNHQAAIIHFDKNEQLKGLHHLDSLYQAIQKKIVLKVNYRSFRAKNSSDIILHPFILKEYNNRWFLIGRKDKKDNIMTLALDRIITVDMELAINYEKRDFDADTYYFNTYGVTVLNQRSIIDVKMRIEKSNAPYVLTKPFHHSQKTIKTNEDGSIVIEMKVHHNYEIERLILGFGESVEVLAPSKLRGRIKNQLASALNQYAE